MQIRGRRWSKHARYVVAITLGTVATFARPAFSGPPPAPEIEFGRQIRPVLAEHCFKCHGPDAAARKARLRLDHRDGAIAPLRGERRAVVPGDSDASALIARITSDDDDFRMPPADRHPGLDAETIALLRAWIEQGAVYDPHWAFVAPRRPAAPAVGNAAWPSNDIDRFVLGRLDSEGLRPAPRADRYTLIRRVSLDLTGLPPAPDDVDAFVRDERPGAYARVVDRLLASPAYGERWARVWLDLARYADTKGYEADRRRTMWPYRDWVIRALNSDLSFDRFTIEQLAGDLLPDATPAQQLATAFHRNTMTNDEGGTDDEEFRSAAIVDRVNTTMQVWMGLTMGCAQCHDHKYDPVSHREYYEFYAFLNTTRDDDAMDERPVLAVPDAEQTLERQALRTVRTVIEREIAAALEDVDTNRTGDAGVSADERGDLDPIDHANVGLSETRRDYVWIDDDLPVGATIEVSGIEGAWTWVTDGAHPVHTGRRASKRTAPPNTTAQHVFRGAHFPLAIGTGDTLFAHVYLDPDDPPRQIMLQWHDGTNWEHRAYWGDDVIPWGVDGTSSRLRLGPLPEPGVWVRLEIDPAAVALTAGDTVGGWAFAQHGGVVYWDAAGARTASIPDDRHLVSQAAWEARARALDPTPLPAAVAQALDIAPDDRSARARDRVRLHYLRTVHRPTRRRLEPLLRREAALAAAERALEDAIPRVPVLREQTTDDRRVTHVLERGSFLSPGAVVSAGVPDVFPRLPESAPPNRLGLATWLVSRDNPLTARVVVNRLWEQLFGTGLVETVEDFGIQGAPPSHPALLDWLATELIEDGWSVKRMLRTVVLSSTYRQSSAVTPRDIERDPHNRLLARGPRFRLEAEMVRDQVLVASGLLNDAMYGPPVFPPQPDGVWQVIYSADRWTTSTGADRHRRALYTFWRRTSPYPSSVTFDAPSREYCVPRRIRTNTPLQALVTLNDPVYVEAAQALARRLVAESGPAPAARVAHGIRICLARPPRDEEVRTLVDLHRSARDRFQADEEAALAMATDPLGPLADDADPADLAAWTVVCNVLLNLDEFLTKG